MPFHRKTARRPWLSSSRDCTRPLPKWKRTGRARGARGLLSEDLNAGTFRGVYPATRYPATIIVSRPDASPAQSLCTSCMAADRGRTANPKNCQYICDRLPRYAHDLSGYVRPGTSEVTWRAFFSMKSRGARLGRPSAGRRSRRRLSPGPPCARQVPQLRVYHGLPGHLEVHLAQTTATRPDTLKRVKTLLSAVEAKHAIRVRTLLAM